MPFAGFNKVRPAMIGRFLCTAALISASMTSGGNAKATASKFDPVCVLPIESIDARTDITAFLQAGLPAELRRAALRRAWTTDPAIRDFKGLQESDWDFADPNAIAGFGNLGPEVDVKARVVQILGERPHAATHPLKQPEESRIHASLANTVWRFLDVAHD